MGFGENLKQERIRAKMSQKQLAEIVGASSRSILNYEQGTRLPKNIEIVNSIAKALGTTPQYLIDGKEEFVINSGSGNVKEILENAEALFAGGVLNDDEMLSFMTRIQTIYLDSKNKAKKYSSQKRK